MFLVLVCTSGGITPVAAAGETPSATPGPFYPATLLPPNLGYLTGIACPQTNRCYIAGSTSGSNPSGVIVTVTASAEQVTTKTYSPNLPLDRLSSISCMDPNDCFAVGTSSTVGTEVTGTADGGNTWDTVAPPTPEDGLPTGANTVSAVSCTTGFCMAVGSQSQSAVSNPNQSAVWTWNNQRFYAAGELNINAVPVPTSALAGAPGHLTAVSCDQSNDCWVTGSGVWHTSDGGQTWTERDPPQLPPTGGGALWSYLDAVQFTSPMDGIVAGGDQCGGPVTHCPGVIFRTADGGTTWTQSLTPWVDSLACAASAPCTAVTSALSPSTGGADGDAIYGSADGSSWEEEESVSGPNFASAACPAAGDCVLVGGISSADQGAVYVESDNLVLGVPAQKSPPSAPLGLASGCAPGSAADERAGAAFADQWWTSHNQNDAEYEASSAFQQLDNIEHAADSRAGNASWQAGFFDALARPNAASDVSATSDPLYALFSYAQAGGGAALSGGSVGFVDRSFYTDLDCALSSGLTSSALSRDLLSQESFVSALSGHPLVSGLLLEPNACVGLFQHLPASEIFDDLGTSGPSQISDDDSAGLASLADAALTANSVAAAPAELGTIVPPPYGPWRPGVLSEAQVDVLAFIADHTEQGFQDLAGRFNGFGSGAASSLIGSELANTATTGDATTLSDAYEAWINRAAGLNFMIDVPQAWLVGSGYGLASIPDMSIPALPGGGDVDLSLPEGSEGASLRDYVETYGESGVEVSFDLVLGVWQQLHLPDATEAAQAATQTLLDDAAGEIADICPAGRVRECTGNPAASAVLGANGVPSGLTLADFQNLYYSDIDALLGYASQYGVINMSNGEVSVPPISAVLLATTTQAPPPILDDPSSAVLVVGHHFAPHTSVSITAHGVNGALAATYTNGAGDFIVPVIVHDKLTPGSYTLIATGKNPEGNATSLSMSVTITTLGAGPLRSDGVPVALIVALVAVLVIAAGGATLWRRRRGLERSPRPA